MNFIDEKMNPIDEKMRELYEMVWSCVLMISVLVRKSKLIHVKWKNNNNNKIKNRGRYKTTLVEAVKNAWFRIG